VLPACRRMRSTPGIDPLQALVNGGFAEGRSVEFIPFASTYLSQYFVNRRLWNKYSYIPRLIIVADKAIDDMGVAGPKHVCSGRFTNSNGPFVPGAQ